MDLSRISCALPFTESQGSCGSRGLWRSPGPQGQLTQGVTGSPFNLLFLQPCSHTFSVQSQGTWESHSGNAYVTGHSKEMENVSLKGLNFAHKHPGGAGGHVTAWMSQLAPHCPQTWLFPRQCPGSQGGQQFSKGETGVQHWYWSLRESEFSSPCTFRAIETKENHGTLKKPSKL